MIKLADPTCVDLLGFCIIVLFGMVTLFFLVSLLCS